MFAKNNYKERLRKMEQKTERFSIRKLSIGAASVLIGLSFLGFNSHTAHAASDENADKNVSTTDSDVASVQDQVNDKGTINTVNASELDKSTDSKQVGEVSSTLDTAQSAKTDSINTAASKEKRTTETQPEAKSTVSTETSTVSRTIKYINPLTNKEVTLADQKAEFKRTVTKYPDSGKTVYGAWEPASAVFSAVKVPEFEGYQASFSSNEVAEEVVTPGANRQITSWILYNKISETHDTNTTIPANPPKISTEISTVSRTLKYVDPITNVEHTLSDQKAEFKRTVTKYPDSGKTVYGAWEPASAVFSAVKVPEFEGYHASFSPSDVAEVVVTPSTDLNLTSWIIYYKNSGGIQYATLADNKVIVTPKGTPVNPIDGIGNVPELKPGTTYSWTNGVPDVNTIGSSTVEITVNQPGLNPQVVTTTIIVTGTEKPGDPGITNPDDSKYSDLFKTVERYIIFDEPVNYYTQTQKAIFGRSKTVAAVNGKAVVTYGNYGVYDPETQTLNSQTEKTLPAVSVKQFDGYTSLVNDEQATVIPSLNVNVDSPNSQIAVTYKKDSSPSTYIPQGKDIITPYGKMPKPEEGIANIPELPAGTKYTWKDNGPDVYTPGTQVAIVTVTYPDGNTDDVPVMVTVEDPIPEGKDITTPNGKVPEAETAIGNVPEMPEGTKYEWQTTPEVKTPGKKPAVVVVTFPDGKSVDVPVTVTVGDPTPTGKDITTPNGKVPEAETAIGNVPEMPEGTRYEWQTTPDVTTPGKKPAVVVVTFPDGNKVDVPVNVTVEEPVPGNNDSTPGEPIVTPDNPVAPLPEEPSDNGNDTNGTPTDTDDETVAPHPTVTPTDDETTPARTAEDNGETAPVHAGVNNNGDNVNHASFYGNSNGNDGRKTLPQTGAHANMVGLLGLMIASVGAIFGLAADKKRKN